MLYPGMLTAHGKLFRERPWGFSPKVNITFPDILHLGLGTQLSQRTWLQVFNLPVSRPTFPSSATPSAISEGKCSQKVVQLLLLFPVLEKLTEIVVIPSYTSILRLPKSPGNKKTQTYVYTQFIVLNLKPSLLFIIY